MSGSRVPAPTRWCGWCVQIESARVEDGLAFIRAEMFPRLRTGGGLDSAEVLIDRSFGNGVCLTV